VKAIFKYSLLITLFLWGCKTINPTGYVSGKTTAFITSASDTSEPLTVLSIAGGLCLVAGMILLVVTSGRKGWYPVIGGIILVILNYMVAKYDDYLFYPLVAFTALISGAWTYKVVKQILLEKKSK
tara:strand:- start:2338 stop:2715 length:378 start_codon:yes stop_codon:yes gene_type:complete